MSLRDRSVSGRAVDVLRWIDIAEAYVHLTPGPIGAWAIVNAFEIAFTEKVLGWSR